MLPLIHSAGTLPSIGALSFLFGAGSFYDGAGSFYDGIRSSLATFAVCSAPAIWHSSLSLVRTRWHWRSGDSLWMFFAAGAVVLRHLPDGHAFSSQLLGLLGKGSRSEHLLMLTPLSPGGHQSYNGALLGRRLVAFVSSWTSHFSYSSSLWFFIHYLQHQRFR